jgi:hypothetical protein
MSSALTITEHAALRMSQRGFMPKDVELILLIGTEIDDGYLVREKDYQEAEHALKRLLQSFRRLVGKRLVVKNGQVVTAFHPLKRYERDLLRDARNSHLYEQGTVSSTSFMKSGCSVRIRRVPSCLTHGISRSV